MIKANRLNSRESTGPRSLEGKAAVRFNALKSGIDAKSQVIPGEDPAALELLTAEYHERYQPAAPEVRALVDTLVTAEWLQHRFRTLEAHLFRFNIHGLFREVEGLQVAQADDCGEFNRLLRQINHLNPKFVPPTPLLVVPPGPSAHKLPSDTPVTNTSIPPNPTCNTAQKAEVPCASIKPEWRSRI